jgi:hypothetical protein
VLLPSSFMKRCGFGPSNFHLLAGASSLCYRRVRLSFNDATLHQLPTADTTILSPLSYSPLIYQHFATSIARTSHPFQLPHLDMPTPGKDNVMITRPTSNVANEVRVIRAIYLHGYLSPNKQHSSTASITESQEPLCLYHNTDVQTLPPPNGEVYTTVHGRGPCSNDYVHSIGTAFMSSAPMPTATSASSTKKRRPGDIHDSNTLDKRLRLSTPGTLQERSTSANPPSGLHRLRTRRDQGVLSKSSAPRTDIAPPNSLQHNCKRPKIIEQEGSLSVIDPSTTTNSVNIAHISRQNHNSKVRGSPYTLPSSKLKVSIANRPTKGKTRNLPSTAHNKIQNETNTRAIYSSVLSLSQKGDELKSFASTEQALERYGAMSHKSEAYHLRTQTTLSKYQKEPHKDSRLHPGGG